MWVVGGRTQEPGHRRGPQPFPPPHFTSSKVRTTKPALRPGPEAIDSGGPQRQAKKGETQGAKEAPAEQSVGHTHSLGVQPLVPPLVEGRMGVPEAWAGLAHHWLLESHPETPRTTPPRDRWPLGLRSCPIGRKAGGWGWGQEASRLASPRSCQPAHACLCGFPPRAPSNPPTLQQIIKTHLYLICLLELIEFLRSANATVCAASRSLARNS